MTNPFVAPLRRLQSQLKEPGVNTRVWFTHVNRVLGKAFPGETFEVEKYRICGDWLDFSLQEIENFTQLIDNYILELLTVVKPGSDFNWQMIHPKILRVVLERFQSGHFADAVEAAFKKINEIVKVEYRKLYDRELDGAKLMKEAFSPKTPAIRLTSMITDSEKAIQLGYMEIFAGSMTGIRNPKAHGNLEISKEEAFEKIVLASHLMRMWDNRV